MMTVKKVPPVKKAPPVKTVLVDKTDLTDEIIIKPIVPDEEIIGVAVISMGKKFIVSKKYYEDNESRLELA
jgi:hypothetical protein